MGRTEEQINRINAMIDIMQKVLTALHALKEDDAVESQVLKDLDLNQGAFRRIVYDTNWTSNSKYDDEGYTKLRESFKDAVPTRHWTEDLFCDVMRISKGASSCGKIPPDVHITMLTALDSLTSREQGIMRGLYQDGDSYTEVGDSVGLSDERVRQIKQHALRKLRTKGRLMYIAFGNDYYMNKQRFQESLIEEYLRNQKLQEIQRLNSLIYARKLVVSGDRREKDTVLKEIGHKGIEFLDLSVRSYNSLKRHGISTIGKLAGCTEEELLKIPFFGMKCLMEIREKLSDYDIYLKEK